MTDKLHVAALILVLAILVSLLAVSASTKQSLPISYLETYHGFKIYILQGYNDDYYLAQSPFNDLCEVYINLGDLKADLEG